MTGHYLNFNRFIKETMALLGIEKRKAEEVLDLASYIKAKDAEKAGGQDKTGSEIVDPGASDKANLRTETDLGA